MKNLYDNVWEHRGLKFRAVPYSVGEDTPCRQCPFALTGGLCGSEDFDCQILFEYKDLIRMSDDELEPEKDCDITGSNFEKVE